MKKILITLTLMFAMWFISCDNKTNKETPIIPVVSSEIIPVDSSKYQEVRYVTAKHFTSSGLYNLHCKMCHGNEGTGDGVIARYHKEEFCPYDLTKVKKPDQEVYYVILNGTEHMPDAKKPVSKHVLTNDDIWLVVVYIKNFQK
jgi:hypothetical protein